ncbi:MAG: cysteine desulfurase [Thermomicrobiales bacterium]|nr:cysteine desulfurase [Thermomicrobiales bacterium]
MDSRTRIYLDHAATTPVDPDVVNIMLPFFTERFGNPSSVYETGRDAHVALDWARSTAGTLLGCAPQEIIFTSGATESNNLSIKGVAWWHHFNKPERKRIVVSAIEHHAVLHSAEAMERHDFEVVVVMPDADGIVQPETIRPFITENTCLVSVMLANNEIGTIQPIREIAEIAHAAGAIMHTDAVQAVGAIPVLPNELGVDLMSITAHKFYGPKGTGLLYCRAGSPIDWQQHGGGQENTRRAGTENLAGIVGTVSAMQFAIDEMDERTAHSRRLRDRLLEAILERVPNAQLNGHPTLRLPNNANIAFTGVDGPALLLALDMVGISASSGSACTSGSTEPSHVLTALGIEEARANGSIRLTVGKDTSDSDVDTAVQEIVSAVERIQNLAAITS